MTTTSTAIRAIHLVTNAAWFGGSLMGAVALNPASREGDTARERAEISADTAEFWESPGKAAMVVQMVKGLVSDDRPDLGDSGVVRL